MKKIILNRWVSASWKTTWTNEQEGAEIVSKDLIRKKLGITPENWSKEKEKEVVNIERATVEDLITFNSPELIIVDNTHLGKYSTHISFYRDLANKNWYEFEVKDFYVDRKEAIERDKNREDTVGEAVINKQFKMHPNWWYPKSPIFRKYDEGIGSCYIIDLDWTLAFTDDKRDIYDGSKVESDRCNIYLKQLMFSLSQDNTMVIMSGRGSEFRKETEDWLINNWIPYDLLIMRKEADTRKDSIIKKELYIENIHWNFNVMWVFDDRNSVCSMWRLELNLPCYQTFYWYF